ncbi:MAG: adenylyltransferase/cytidyltransferase family protein [Aigarchaeota archaeon]|nr:adenylyltransferase/cytidyltransferase family protein [Aigarchaeota archaeon]MCX8193434.1 adenylyltransferase/cytidyltransferase family protein [Nitrososphaeria archaeon]MDW7985834.1 adenylyltransferase/cytidyltransferase family protein [Nitrososphaerota archaeon]
MGKKKVVLTSGAFDIIHPGHIKMLWEAKKIGGKNSKLVVVLATDETIKKRKNRESLFNEKSRRFIMSNLKPVDEVIVGYKKFSFEKVLKKVKPDIIVFGYDQEDLMKEFKKFLEKKKMKIKIYRARHYKIGNINSTTDIINKVKKMLGRYDLT